VWNCRSCCLSMSVMLQCLRTWTGPSRATASPRKPFSRGPIISIGVARYGALGHVPPWFPAAVYFSGHFRAEQTLPFDFMCCLSSKTVYRSIALSVFIAWISWYFCVSPLNYFLNFVPLLAARTKSSFQFPTETSCHLSPAAVASPQRGACRQGSM